MSTDSQTLEQLLEQFHNEERCIDHLIRCKWPNGFCCSRCGHSGHYRIATRRMPLFQCARCQYQASPTAGTVMEGSRTSLCKWFVVLYYMTRLSPGTNAVFISRAIGVTYKTAWLMMHKIRHAIGLKDAETQLCGFIHADKATYARPQLSGVALHPREVPVIAAAASPQYEATSADYIKIKMVPKQRLRDTGIGPNAVSWFKDMYVRSDAKFHCTVGTYTRRTEMRALPYHKLAVKWINSTFHGLGKRHLQAYLNEFCFFINCSLQKANPFPAIAILCGSSPTVTYRQLTRQVP